MKINLHVLDICQLPEKPDISISAAITVVVFMQDVLGLKVTLMPEGL